MKSWMPFEWIAAIRFLREGRMQSLLIIVGVLISGLSAVNLLKSFICAIIFGLVERK